MDNKQYGLAFKIPVTVAFILMIVINGLGNLLSLNGQDTGQVSDSYRNIFAPAAITFAIWI